MDDALPHTDFVRRTILEPRYEPDTTYARDLVSLERLLATRPIGMADSIARFNLVSRYPREADAILEELGTRPFVPLEQERLSALVDERLRLALLRNPLPRMRPAESPDRLEF